MMSKHIFPCEPCETVYVCPHGRTTTEACFDCDANDADITPHFRHVSPEIARGWR